MAHITAKQSYEKLTKRLNQFPQGAPASKTLYKILEILFSEKEAELVAQIPVRPFTAKKAASIWKISEKEATIILDQLASRAVLLDIEQKGQMTYVLPPPMAGFFEFAMMRTRGDIDQKLLSELFYQYLNEEEDFIKDLFVGTETSLLRTFVQEPVLDNGNTVHILDYERASHIIKETPVMGISMCYCRHKMLHLDKHCDAPMDICMTFGNVADSLIRHGHARKVEIAEGLELLNEAYENNLVQCGENTQSGVSFICNCCGCCCEALIAAKKFGNLHPVAPSNYYPVVDEYHCTKCEMCVGICPVHAISIEKNEQGLTSLTIDYEICLGCGVCVRKCKRQGLSLERKDRQSQIITPVTSVHRIVQMAIDKGTLQDLIFDNQAMESHRAMAAVLGAILKMPGVRQGLASNQVKSKYLGSLLAKK